MKEIEGETSYQRSYRRNICTLIKADMNQLYNRLRGRYNEYMSIFSKRRTREHFKEIFVSRYLTIPLSDMAMLDQDMIVSIDSFYYEVGELHWYLYSTEEMPATVMELVMAKLRIIKKVHDISNSLLEASLQVYSGELESTEDYSSQVLEDD